LLIIRFESGNEMQIKINTLQREMAKFSLEDGEGSSFPRPKRQRPSSPSSPPPDFTMGEIVREDEESEEDEEEDDVDTSDGSEEEDEEEEEEEEEQVEEIVRPQPPPPQRQPQPPPPPPPQQQQQPPPPRPQENNQITTVGLQPPQHRLFEASVFLGHTLVGPSRNGVIYATLSDPEVLDCPICCEPLTIPVFQVFVTCFCFFPPECDFFCFNDVFIYIFVLNMVMGYWNFGLRFHLDAYIWYFLGKILFNYFEFL
jgi:E3 ubiquitin-protein ligase SIAH1